MKTLRTHRGTSWLLAIFLLTLPVFLQAKWEREQLDMENQLQDRIEKILARVLPANSYLASVSIELVANPTVKSAGQHVINGAFLGKSRFVLPGVPAKKEFSQNEQFVEEEAVVSPQMETAVKKISITVLVSPDIGDDQIKSLREFISASIPFDPSRGDSLDIHASPLLKSRARNAKSALEAAAKQEGAGRLFAHENLVPVILLLTLALTLLMLGAFLFGPLSRFFDRIPAVLPRIGEQAALASSARSNQPAGAIPAAVINQMPGSSKNGAARGNEKTTELEMPFRFIREEQLGSLSVLMQALSVPQVAVVLAYLPPPWASRLLASLNPGVQTQVLGELSQGREIPQEFLSEVETQVKEKLPYVVGGNEWIQTVYQMTQPQTQHLLLGALSKQSPDLALTLRAKTFFIEDLRGLDPTSLRLLVQEAGYPAMGLALKGENRDIRESILRNLAAGIRDVILQEMEMSRQDEAAITDARNQVVAAGQRLLADGRIVLGAAPGAK